MRLNDPTTSVSFSSWSTARFTSSSRGITAVPRGFYLLESEKFSPKLRSQSNHFLPRGCSIGGFTVLSTAAKYPELVKGLVLLNVAGKFADKDDKPPVVAGSEVAQEVRDVTDDVAALSRLVLQFRDDDSLPFFGDRKRCQTQHRNPSKCPRILLIAILLKY